MKILLLGATGRTGRLVYQEALKSGYEVTCLVSNKSKLPPHDKATIIEGSPMDRDALRLSLNGCRAVLTTLNISRKSDFPWSGLRTPETFLSDTLTNLLSLKSEFDLKRIVICSAWGANETKEDLPGWFKWFIDNSNIGVAYRDHERQEKLLINSDLEWTIVRPVGLTNSKKTQQIIESFNNSPKPKMTISRLSVAKYMVKSLEENSLIGKKPVISSR